MKFDHATLQHARDTYGNANQILVAIEELNELACVLAKYPRFDTHEAALQKTAQAATDEVADVYVILEHVKAIFGMTDNTLQRVIDKKTDRLSRWMTVSDSMEQTTIDREV